MKKFLLFAYAFCILLFLIGIYYTLNGGITMPVKRHQGLFHLVGWPAWALSFGPLFLALSMWAKFDSSLSLDEKKRNIIYSVFQFAFLACCGKAGFYATKL